MHRQEASVALLLYLTENRTFRTVAMGNLTKSAYEWKPLDFKTEEVLAKI
jgi:hypothetical protein